MAENTRESDPLVGFNFAIEVDGPVQCQGYFTEVSGIASENEVVEHKIVNDQGQEMVQKIPGRLKFNDITLKWGLTHDLSFWDWRNMVVEGDMGNARANCSIIMFDRNYTPIVRWDVQNAWPTKVSGPSLSSGSNEFSVEELTITHEGIMRVQ